MTDPDKDSHPLTIDYACNTKAKAVPRLSKGILLTRIVSVLSIMVAAYIIGIDEIAGNSEYMSSPLIGVLRNYPAQIAVAHRYLFYARVCAFISILGFVSALIILFGLIPQRANRTVGFGFLLKVYVLILAAWLGFFMWDQLVMNARLVYP